MIITGESSGELYGALLARALKDSWPDARVLGVGGEKMKEAGVEVFAGIASAFGAFEIITSLKKIKETFNKTIDTMRSVMPSVVVLIDYPDFNFKVAAEAKRLGIKVLYYVSPQVWAWRKGRVKTIGRRVEKVAVLLPFEEAIYREEGIPCEFVGHPILEEIESLSADTARKNLGAKEGARYLALLPGSRPHELKNLLPVMLELVKAFRAEFPGYGFLLPLAPNMDVARFQGILRELQEEGVTVIKGNAVSALKVSEMAVIASGTAALQAAFLETPMVVIYKLTPLSYLLGRLIIKVKHITLVNLMLGRAVVTELLQSKANAGEVMSELRRLMSDKAHRDGILGAFKSIKALYAGKKPSLRVAGIIGEMAGWGA
ncbi:MAG: lipid-A-disaccharide synthase [Thermodesulfovibrionales bacterium]|nr:lipid-A-disaccharide synthase [Thermodesulfovibrionales bacterium]